MIRALPLLLAACAVPWKTGPESPGVYPHPEGYALIEQHGPDAVADPALCGSCHGVGAPGCAECHANFPHTPPPGRTHETANAACADCHAAAGTHAATEAPCARCHTSYPHDAGWAIAGGHGAWALARQRPEVVCGNCHGASLDGAATAPGCGDCHVKWPHPEGFDHAAAAAPDPTACAGCHGAAGEGGPSGVACTSCHLGMPHPADWAASGHLAAAGQLGEATCLRCHSPGDGPATMPATCGAQCHGGAP